MSKAAIIDLGTNTFHLLLVEWEGHRYQILKKVQVPVKLGQGGIERRVITPEAFTRGLNALMDFQLVIQSFADIDHVEVFGTSALRSAENAGQFAREAEKILGCKLQIIDGGAEATLIYDGVRHAVPMGTEPHLIMDIGGGSVEFIIADNKYIYWKHSFEIGGTRLVERFHRNDPLSQEDITNLESFLEAELKTVWHKAQKYAVKTLVGASGSFESFAEIEINLYHFSTEQIPFVHHILQLDHFQGIAKQIISSSRQELLALPGLAAFRAEMMAVVTVLVQYVVNRLAIQKVIVSDYSLKEGVMFGLMKYLGQATTSIAGTGDPIPS